DELRPSANNRDEFSGRGHLTAISLHTGGARRSRTQYGKGNLPAKALRRRCRRRASCRATVPAQGYANSARAPPLPREPSAPLQVFALHPKPDAKAQGPPSTAPFGATGAPAANG